MVGPLAVYRIARACDVSEVWSLALSGIPPLFGVLADWLRWRILEMVGGVVLGGILASLLLALISNDPRVLLLESTVFTATFGVACLASLSRQHPLIFYFAQALYGGPRAAEGQKLGTDFDTYPEVRHFFRVLTVVWGLAYLIESAIRIAVTLLASTETALLANRTVPWVVYGALMVGSVVWGNRLSVTEPAEG